MASGEKPAPFQPNLVHYNEISIVGSSSTTREDFSRVAQLVENGVIDVTPLITSRYSWRAPAAFAQAENAANISAVSILKRNLPRCIGLGDFSFGRNDMAEMITLKLNKEGACC
ncbi:MAG: hypothetical protein U0401_17810 [Anaerolineae bacterium]